MTNYEDLGDFKDFLIQYKTIVLNIDGLRLSEKTIKNDLVCYVYNISVSYDYFYLKTAVVKTKANVVENCGKSANNYNYELEESRNLYIVQLLFGLYFLYKGLKTWFDLMRIIERINVKLRSPNAQGAKEDIELDFNFYRFMLSRNVKSTVITKYDLRYFSTTNICFKLIRPLYFVCMVGYVIQVFGSTLNLLGVYIMDEVSQNQMNLMAIAIMCSWVDLYTITSQSNETGLVNDTFLQVYKQFLYFTAYILIVLAAFAAFALCIFNQSIYFSNLVGTAVALFAFMYGDSIRATFLTYQDNPFAILFLVAVIIVLYSCLAQFYLAVFTIKFQTTSDKTNKLITMLNKNKEGFMRMQREIIDSKSKNFGEEINFLMEYLDKKAMYVRGTTLDERNLASFGGKKKGIGSTDFDDEGITGGRASKKDRASKNDDKRVQADDFDTPALNKDKGALKTEEESLKKKKDLEEDIKNTFNESKLPERQKTLLRKTYYFELIKLLEYEHY